VPSTPSKTESPADYKRQSYQGLGDGMSRAIELAITPAIFGGLGYLLDQKFNTQPVFMIVLVVLTLIGMFVRNWAAYKVKMQELEAEAVANAEAKRSTLASTPREAISVTSPGEFANRDKLPSGVTL
jgi:F0F1-type ATP synthase assembly protein I